jgi:hypothetical protein
VNWRKASVGIDLLNSSHVLKNIVQNEIILRGCLYRLLRYCSKRAIFKKVGEFGRRHDFEKRSDFD